MKKLKILAALCLVFCLTAVNVSAAGAYNWYCKRAKGGARPEAEPDMEE